MVHDWKSILIPKYEIRKTREQKTAFISMLRETYGDRMRVEEAGTLVKSRNIILGDPERAKVIYTAHYDTCARLPFPNFITPRNFALYLLYQIVLSLALLLPVFALEFLVGFLTRNLSPAIAFLCMDLTLLAGFFGIIWLFFLGKPNPHTANDNTSGVVTVLTLADRLEGREDAAFILFDNEENGLLGSAAYASAHKNIRSNTMLVNFDCVSDGDNILILFSKQAQETAYYETVRERANRILPTHGKWVDVCGKKGTFYPSDQANFKKTAAVCALNRGKHVGLYMDKIHTPKDTVFMEENIEGLAEVFDCFNEE